MDGGGDEAEDRYLEMVSNALALADVKSAMVTMPGILYPYIPIPTIVAALKGHVTQLIKEVATLQLAEAHRMAHQLPREQEVHDDEVHDESVRRTTSSGACLRPGCTRLRNELALHRTRELEGATARVRGQVTHSKENKCVVQSNV